MTPMPGTSGRRPRPGELAASGLDVLAPALADRGTHPVPLEMALLNIGGSPAQ